MTWEKPSFREVSMSSEIGAYQEDFEEREPGDIVRRSQAADQTMSVPQQVGLGT